MIAFYQKLIAIKVCVYNLPNTAVETAFDTAFTVAPTRDCQQVLKKYGLFFKPVDNGGLVIQERFGDSQGGASPRFDINELTRFSFIVSTTDTSLYSRVRPYVGYNTAAPPEPEPVPLTTFLGAARVLYFDNLDGGNAINSTPINSDCQRVLRVDASGQPIRDPNGQFQFDPLPVIPLSTRAAQADNGVDIADLASTVSDRLPVPQAATSFAVSALYPGIPAPLPVNPPDETSNLPYYRLDHGAYQVSQTVGATAFQETIFADKHLVSSQQLGIIQVLRTDSTPLNYEIKFELL